MAEEDQKRYSRRRAIAGVALLAILALLITAIGSHGSAHHDHATSDPSSHHAPAPHLTAADRSGIGQHALTHQAEEKAVDSVLAYTSAVTSGGNKGHELALTFDDGPGPYTQQLVGVLDKD